MKTFIEWLLESLTNQELPPEPGSAPIPSGHVRLYHQTSDRNVDSIRNNGIQKSHSRGKMLQEPTVIWATEDTFYGDLYQQGIATVEFSVPMCDNSMKFPCFRSPTYVMGEVVPPESIIAIHEYWHSIARQLISDYDEFNPETLELMNVFKNVDDNHRKAADFYLRHTNKHL